MGLFMLSNRRIITGTVMRPIRTYSQVVRARGQELNNEIQHNVIHLINSNNYKMATSEERVNFW